MRTAMAAVCKFCTVVAVAVCAIILASHEVNAQRWVAYAVRIDFGERLNTCSECKQDEAVGSYRIRRKRYRLNFSWVIWREDVLTGRLFALSALRLGWALLQTCTNVKHLFNTRQLGRVACEQDCRVALHGIMKNGSRVREGQPSVSLLWTSPPPRGLGQRDYIATCL